ITAVGGTNHVPEAAVAFSGGGFSDYFPRPWYQEAAVGKWIKKFPHDKYKGLFNRSFNASSDLPRRILTYSHCGNQQERPWYP
ncbi:hypothetical protein DXG03_007531, partial [Asterophora parasitica]